MEPNNCCGGGTTPSGRKKNCLICGRPLIYLRTEKLMQCHICRRVLPANAACAAGHFVCDGCHSGGGAPVLALLQHSGERAPLLLLEQVLRLESVHLHGPEHHSIVPCVLVTAWHNCGGGLDLGPALTEAWQRGQKIPGGACGFMGVCGAAAGAGVFASILLQATPLTKEQWAVPQRLTAACLEALTAVGGPRCCKRTSRLAIETAAAFAAREFGVTMPLTRPACVYQTRNRECIGESCPYYPRK